MMKKDDENKTEDNISKINFMNNKITNTTTKNELDNKNNYSDNETLCSNISKQGSEGSNNVS